MAEIDESFKLPMRAIERYGGLEAVGSTLWLEHVAGIRYRDSEEIFITPEVLAAEEARKPKADRLSALSKAAVEEMMFYEPRKWLVGIALHTLPIRISGNTEMKPVIFDADFKLFKTPKDLARSPTVIGEVTTDSLLELIGEEETEDDPETTPAKDTGDSTVTMSLRLIPWQGEVSGVGYYPGYDAMDYGLTAMEMDEEAVRMQLHHRIYFELFKRQPKTPPEPLISPHQF